MSIYSLSVYICVQFINLQETYVDGDFHSFISKQKGIC